MSLDYVVKLEMLIAHMLPLSCYRKKLQNLSHLNYGLQIRQIWIHSMWEMLQEKVYKTRITALELSSVTDATDEWLSQWRHSPASSLCSQSLFQFVQVSGTCFVHLLLQ